MLKKLLMKRTNNLVFLKILFLRKNTLAQSKKHGLAIRKHVFKACVLIEFCILTFRKNNHEYRTFYCTAPVFR